jgi:spore coat protein U-like protein
MKHFIHSEVIQGVALFLLFMPVSSDAAGVNATRAFNITARYQQTCEITSVPLLDFGLIVSNTGDATTAGTMVVTCTAGSATPFGVWAPLSANANGTQRRMKNSDASAGNYLNYTVQVGNTSGTTLPTTSTNTGFTSPTGAAGTDTGVYLRATLPAGQTLTQGYYIDDLILTVDY